MQQALEALESGLAFDTHSDVLQNLRTALAMQQAEPVAMRMPKVGDRVTCLEDESLGEVVSLTAGGSPDIKFDDGSRGTYLLREFAELFGYAEQRQRQWVGLEPEEILDLFDRNNVYGSKWVEFARTVEAKLKEKNSD
jgi:hypothetical protein